jgi:hypothetical protein
MAEVYNKTYKKYKGKGILIEQGRRVHDRRKRTTPK